CSLCFLCAGWMIVKVLREPAPAANDDDEEGFGGIPEGFVFPVFDPPGGCHLNDLLMDRLPAGTPEKPVPGTELSTRSIRTTDRPARRHPVLSDPSPVTIGWHAGQKVTVTK
ncbi:MAG: hypothetical protein ICV83_13720, partial [Cytophagales bacterium]|nr:hypothetical protein [Cytophagales bacterium]